MESRKDYTASESDDVLVRGVEADPDALGYFGYAYYRAQGNRLKALGMDDGKGAVLPSEDTML